MSAEYWNSRSPGNPPSRRVRDPGPGEVNREAELAEEYLIGVMEDVAHIRRLVKGEALEYTP